MPMKEIQKKICLIGDGSVGKTSLIRKYVLDVFDDKYISTVGTKLTRKELMLKGKDFDVNLTLMIWDIAGQREYQKLHVLYYQGANGALVVVDMTKKETLTNAVDWATSIRKACGDIPLVFLINKCDLTQQAQMDEAAVAQMAAPLKAKYLFTSAKTGQNVEEAFELISRTMVGI